MHPFVGLVNGQPQYSQPSMTLLPYIRQCRLQVGDLRPLHAQPANLPSCTGASNKSQSAPKLEICCLSQFNEDTGEPSVSTQEIKTNTPTVDRWPNQDSNLGSCAVQPRTVTIQLQRRTLFHRLLTQIRHVFWTVSHKYENVKTARV